MNESEKIDPRELSPLALAFVGDSVLELLVRQRLVEHHRLSASLSFIILNSYLLFILASLILFKIFFCKFHILY